MIFSYAKQAEEKSKFINKFNHNKILQMKNLQNNFIAKYPFPYFGAGNGYRYNALKMNILFTDKLTTEQVNKIFDLAPKLLQPYVKNEKNNINSIVSHFSFGSNPKRQSTRFKQNYRPNYRIQFFKRSLYSRCYSTSKRISLQQIKNTENYDNLFRKQNRKYFLSIKI